jgi:hypothetical protein
MWCEKGCIYTVLRIRIKIFFSPGSGARIRIRVYVLRSGSGSISYSNELIKIRWKEKFNKVCLLVGSCWTYSQGKSS